MPTVIENYCESKASTRNGDLPSDLRMLIAGSSGCGKTNLVVNLIIKHIKWLNLYIITKSPEQELYVKLRELNNYNNDEDVVKFVNDGSELNFDDIEPYSLIIFDNYMREKDQTLPITTFTRGRHKNISAMYITQKFTNTPMAIRNNCNVIIMFKCDNKRRAIRIEGFLKN